jgi:hypothetical protein
MAEQQQLDDQHAPDYQSIEQLHHCVEENHPHKKQ